MKKKFHLIDYARDNKMHTVTEEFLLQYYHNDTDTNNINIEDYIKKCKTGDNFVCEKHNYFLVCLTAPNKDYSIPIIYESYIRAEVQAQNIKEACIKAVKEFLNIPDPNYIEDSFKIDWEGIETKETLPTEEEVLEKVFK